MKREKITWLIAIMATVALLVVGVYPATAASGKSKTTEQRIQRLEDIRAIKNLMGRYIQFVFAYEGNRVISMFAMDEPDVRITRPEGVWEGKESVTEYLMAQDKSTNPTEGEMYDYPLASPLIQVAGDGQTAKVLWDVPGIEGRKDANDKALGYFNYFKYAVDFKKVNGEWKFWHIRWYPSFATPFKEMSWAETKKMYLREGLPEPDRAAGGIWYYDGKSLPRGPEPPQPYETFDPKTAY